MKPEEKAEIILWDWLKTKSKNIEEVYFNRKNKLNAPIFKVEGNQEKPDLIVKICDEYGTKYYAVEVKSSDKSKNILESSKIIDKYLKNYTEETTIYFIEDKKINLKGFLIATDKSKEGHLFKKESFIDNTDLEGGESKFNAATKYKLIPTKEGARTFEFIRMLWNEYGKVRKDCDYKLDIGIIIGNNEDSYSPHMMITSFYQKNKRWTQRWWKM